MVANVVISFLLGSILGFLSTRSNPHFPERFFPSVYHKHKDMLLQKNTVIRLFLSVVLTSLLVIQSYTLDRLSSLQNFAAPEDLVATPIDSENSQCTPLKNGAICVIESVNPEYKMNVYYKYDNERWTQLSTLYNTSVTGCPNPGSWPLDNICRCDFYYVSGEGYQPCTATTRYCKNPNPQKKVYCSF